MKKCIEERYDRILLLVVIVSSIIYIVATISIVVGTVGNKSTNVTKKICNSVCNSEKVNNILFKVKDPVNVEIVLCSSYVRNQANGIIIEKNYVVNKKIEMNMPALAREVEYIEEPNYVPTQQEREYSYKIAFSEAGIEDALGQTLVVNVAINNMREKGYSSLIDEYTASGRYSSVKNGVPSIKDKDGTWRPVREEDLSEELKNAVDEAFRRDYTEEYLKQAMEELSQKDPNFVVDSKYYEGGALYFYNPKAISSQATKARSEIKVKFEYGRHVFYRFWDK